MEGIYTETLISSVMEYDSNPSVRKIHLLSISLKPIFQASEYLPFQKLMAGKFHQEMPLRNVSSEKMMHVIHFVDIPSKISLTKLNPDCRRPKNLMLWFHHDHHLYPMIIGLTYTRNPVITLKVGNNAVTIKGNGNSMNGNKFNVHYKLNNTPDAGSHSTNSSVHNASLQPLSVTCFVEKEEVRANFFNFNPSQSVLLWVEDRKFELVLSSETCNYIIIEPNKVFGVKLPCDVNEYRYFRLRSSSDVCATSSQPFLGTEYTVSARFVVNSNSSTVTIYDIEDHPYEVPLNARGLVFDQDRHSFSSDGVIYYMDVKKSNPPFPVVCVHWVAFAFSLIERE